MKKHDLYTISAIVGLVCGVVLFGILALAMSMGVWCDKKNI